MKRRLGCEVEQGEDAKKHRTRERLEVLERQVLEQREREDLRRN